MLDRHWKRKSKKNLYCFNFE